MKFRLLDRQFGYVMLSTWMIRDVFDSHHTHTRVDGGLAATSLDLFCFYNFQFYFVDILLQCNIATFPT